jgi:hypothetical protein
VDGPHRGMSRSMRRRTGRHVGPRVRAHVQSTRSAAVRPPVVVVLAVDIDVVVMALARTRQSAGGQGAGGEDVADGWVVGQGAGAVRRGLATTLQPTHPGRAPLVLLMR